MTNTNRWSLSAFVLLLLVIISAVAFRNFVSVLILFAVAIFLLVGMNMVKRRRRH